MAFADSEVHDSQTNPAGGQSSHGPGAEKDFYTFTGLVREKAYNRHRMVSEAQSMPCLALRKKLAGHGESPAQC
jgi:hypothetical protein